MKIAVHDGLFHADETIAVAILENMDEENNEIVRTHDPALLEQCDLRIDIGGVFDAEGGDFDHHQKEGKPPTRSNGVPRAAAGAVWAHYGRKAIDVVLGPMDREVVDAVHQRVDRKVIEGIDAIDCGWEAKVVIEQDGQGCAWPEYWDEREGYPLPSGRPGVSPSLSAIVAGKNPQWWETAPDPDARFAEAVDWMKIILTDAIREAVGHVMAWNVIQRAEVPWYQPEMLVLEEFCPWAEHIYERENQTPGGVRLLYVVFPNLRGGWVVQQVPKVPLGKEGRKPLPEKWRGLRGKALTDVLGLPEPAPEDEPAWFVHTGGFIGGGPTKASAELLAHRAIDM